MMPKPTHTAETPADAHAPLPPSVPVLIVGGGPVGLTTALLLARHGVRALVVERHPGTSIHPRARGINIRSMEIFRELGLEDRIREAGRALSSSQFMLWVETLAGREVRRVPVWSVDGRAEQLDALSPTDWASCAQDDLEPILLAEARRVGVDVRFGTECASFEQDDGCVTATLVHRASGERHTVQALYLVGADGARSGVRAELGLQMVGPGSLSRHISIYARANLRQLVEGRHFILCFVEHPGVCGVLLSVNHTDRWVLNVPEEVASGASEASPTEAHCVELFRLAVGVPDLPIEILSVLLWEARAEVAERFQVGRVFLAGDSAHVMPPTGAFGMNTGIQDAHNLAWKLAAALSGTASARLLETYGRERRPVAALTVENAVRAGRQQFAHATPGKRMTGQDTSAQAATAPAEPVDDLAVMLGYWYASGAVIGSPDAPLTLDALGAAGLKPDGRPGTRAPHRWLSGPGNDRSTIDRCAGKLTLLTGTAGGAWSEAVRAVASEREIAVAVVQAREIAELVGDGALLVRPDGFVGWRSGSGEVPSSELLGRVLDELLGRVYSVLKEG